MNGLPAVTFQSGQALPTTKTVGDILGVGQKWAFVAVARGIGDQPTPGGPPLLGSSSDTVGIFVPDHRISPQVNAASYLGGSYTSNAAFVFGHANAVSGSHSIFNSTPGGAANFTPLSGAASQILRIGINSGGQNFGFMQILEMMAFNRFKTAAEFAAIAAALRNKYAIS